MDNTTNAFTELFGWKTTTQPGFKIVNIEDSDLDIYRKVTTLVKARVKESKITTEYNIESKELLVNGTPIDLYYFGYFTKQLEEQEQ